MKLVSPRILVVDDEPHLRRVLRTILKAEGFEVVTASDGETALQISRESHPDVVLLDLAMPGMDGREVCRRLREFSEEIRVVYFTGKAEAYRRPGRKELEREADAIITKPASKRKILACISEVLAG